MPFNIHNINFIPQLFYKEIFLPFGILKYLYLIEYEPNFTYRCKKKVFRVF